MHVLTLGNGMNAIGRGTSSHVRLDFGDGNVSCGNHAASPTTLASASGCSRTATVPISPI